ncbi:MAG TPA: hypothetical protein VN282_20885 [Pyrinomonadaceae bacterium]|nr:hypothetical protein [Pyrinomonadaceae bacterium]
MAKVLMVLDGKYRFSEMDNTGTKDFTYKELVDALTAAGHQVTKAHRENDISADVQMFIFQDDNLLEYDVIWMIGHGGRNVSSGESINLPEDQLRAIALFMEAGGGVFATGDHDSIGSNMCGRILRVRAMRAWYGVGDDKSPMTDIYPPMMDTFPRNYPPQGTTRADTTRKNSARGDYDLDNDGMEEAFVWFENQSDSVPQPLTLEPPTHPIMKRGDKEIKVFPDHMHEGKVLDAEVETGYPYETSEPEFNGETFVEFPMVAGHREMPRVIAKGSTVQLASKYAYSNSDLDTAIPVVETVNVLSVYDGRTVGVGRIVIGSTFHHYVDINLTGDSAINTQAQLDRTGEDAAKGKGFNYNEDSKKIYEDIKAVFDNITNWLARPRPKIQLILERSTFSQAEADADSNFAGAILVTVDGLKPNQFPGGGVTSLLDADFQEAWAPTITPQEPAGLDIVPTGVDSDDPDLNDRLQRITFTYRVEVTDPAFGYPGNTKHVQIDAGLTSAAVSAPLADSAQITLVKSANPFMLDLAGGNTKPWLSSDVKVFPVVAGAPNSGLVNEASREQALEFLRGRLSTMTDAEFDALSGNQAASALSPFERTTESDRKVYNFGVARVRLPATGATAVDVRVFFRIFTSQTTAALTYKEAPEGVPIQGYKKTPGDEPIALPGTNTAGTEWLSFPMFLAQREATPEDQTDEDNVQDISPGVPKFFGCLIDNNLPDVYLPLTPGGGAATDLPTLMMGEHQCIVAQIEFPDTPIPNGANPFTSDKLSQRNIALSPIANPGLDASRMALHTFEIEATPHAIGDNLPPDELLLEWHGGAPEGTEVRLYIPGWDAGDVVDLAERFYPRHEIRALDAHTVALPGGGTRYVPIPTSQQRRTGVIAAHLPLGVKRGQRFDLSVRQVTTRGRRVDIRPKMTTISLAEAEQLLGHTAGAAAGAPVERGVFELGGNRVLITDLRVLDGGGDHAVIVEHPDAATVAAAVQQAKRWRETVGAFQLGIPVSVKAEMLAHHLRLLSVLRWRAEWLRPNSRWYETFIRYVELSAEKVRALGGDPYSVPPTPDGRVPLPGKGEERDGCSGCLLGWLRPLVRWLKRA